MRSSAIGSATTLKEAGLSRFLSAIGLAAMAFASAAGTGFTSTGDAAESMAMSVMTGVAVVSYAVSLYVLRPAAR